MNNERTKMVLDLIDHINSASHISWTAWANDAKRVAGMLQEVMQENITLAAKLSDIADRLDRRADDVEKNATHPHRRAGTRASIKGEASLLRSLVAEMDQ